jgi:hypothetical protein
LVCALTSSAHLLVGCGSLPAAVLFDHVGTRSHGASIDAEGRPGNEAGTRGGEEQGPMSDLVDCPEARNRPVLRSLPQSLSRPSAQHQLGFDRPRGDRIDGYPVVLQIKRGGASEPDDPRLRRAVGSKIDWTDEPGH